MSKQISWLKNDSKKYGVYAFGLNFLIAFITFFPIMARGNGLFTLCNDFNLQQIPLNMLSNQAIKAGEIGWSWQVDLGSSFIGATSFYVTGSPFFYLSLLFPATQYPRLVGWLFMLKYAVAGFSSYVYIGQYCKDKRYALIGCILYAFSGFQATNMLFYHFHDVVAFFPWMLYGVDQLVDKDRKGVLAFASFLCACINFYFFVGEVVFLVIYFIVKYWVTDWKYWKKFLQCLLEGILGVGMSMIIFLPSIAFNMENPRTSEFLPLDQWFAMNKRYLLHVLRVFLLPANTMMRESYVVNEDYSSWAAYLPMVGLIPTVLFQIRNKKNWLTRMILVLIVISIIPILNSIFYFVTSNNYHRWFYMMILLFCVATSMCLEQMETTWKGFAKWQRLMLSGGGVALTIALWVGSKWWDQVKFQVIFDQERFAWTMLIALLGYIVTTVLLIIPVSNRWRSYLIMLGISVFSVITTREVCLDYKSFHTMDVDFGNLSETDYYDRIMAYHDFENPDDAYRFASMDNIANMVGSISGDAAFTSTVNGSIIELHEQISEGREVFTPYTHPGMNQLFSAKYIIETTNQAEDMIIRQSHFEEESSFEGQDSIAQITYGDYVDSIYASDGILPIGYSYDTYVTQTEVSGYTNDEKRMLMLQTLIIPDAMEKEVSEVLEHFLLTEAILDWEKLEPIWTEYHTSASERFTREKNRFTSNVRMDQNGYLFYSVPFDQGWKAYVNGKEAKIININGLMAVRADMGNNEICFQYRNQYMWIGMIVSVGCFAIWIFLRRKNKVEHKG